MSSHGPFVRAIRTSLRSQRRPAIHTPSHANHCTQSTIPTYHYGKAPRPQHWALCRSIYTSSRMYQGQAAAVSTQKPSTSTPSNTSTKAPTQSSSAQPTLANLKAGLSDQPKMKADEKAQHVDWSTSFHGMADAPFSKEAASVLLQSLNPKDVEIKPDGIIYLPEIKYRRILNQAFGPGGWGLAPRGESTVTAKAVTREYALLAHGRLVSIARGEQEYFSPDGIPTAAEGCKSNAMMRCCKDLGVASELWDPTYIRQFKKEHIKTLWVEHLVTKRKQKISLRKDVDLAYPWKESRPTGT